MHKKGSQKPQTIQTIMSNALRLHVMILASQKIETQKELHLKSQTSCEVMSNQLVVLKTKNVYLGDFLKVQKLERDIAMRFVKDPFFAVKRIERDTLLLKSLLKDVLARNGYEAKALADIRIILDDVFYSDTHLYNCHYHLRDIHLNNDHYDLSEQEAADGVLSGMYAFRQSKHKTYLGAVKAQKALRLKQCNGSFGSISAARNHLMESKASEKML